LEKVCIYINYVILKYEGYDDLKAEHHLFISKIAEVEEKFNTGKLVLSVGGSTFLETG
jgi:hypothetical protein